MKIKNVLSVGLVFTCLTIGGFTYTNASAKYVGNHAIPTELRGTWYHYEGSNKWTTYKLTKNRFKYNWKTLYSLSGKGYRKLSVKKYPKGKKYGYGGTNYVLNSLAKNDVESLGTFWLSHKKVNGKRTLRFYLHQGVFNVFTKDKIKHNYTYVYNGQNYLGQIGK